MMKNGSDLEKITFVLSTEQYEVLIAFEEEESLAEVAERVRRDPSVVSRTLKTISEIAPLLEKQQGKWRITPLGRQFNRLTKNYLSTQAKLIHQNSTLRLAPHTLPAADESSALLVLGTQVGFMNPMWGPRNNPDAEIKIESILKIWRSKRAPIVFCQHVSKEKGSPLFQGTSGSEFIPNLSPKSGECVVAKHHNSAFLGTDLHARLDGQKVRNVVLVGFSTSHCVDATARAAFDFGFNVFVVSDSTAAFDRIGPDGKHYSAETLHSATMAILHQEYATVIDSTVLLSHFSNQGIDANDL